MNKKNQISSSGLRQIDLSLQQVKNLLVHPDLNLIEQWILEGRQRELYAARWLYQFLDRSRTINQSYELTNRFPNSLINLNSPINQPQSPWELLNQTALDRLELGLQNLTPTPLEIDILKPEKKRELLQIILAQFWLLINELATSQLDSAQLLAKIPTVLSDLWQAATTRFLGKYYQLSYEGKSIELVPALLQDRSLIQSEILAKIPLVFDLCSYLLCQTPVIINNTSYDLDAPEAIAKSQVILENLLIQVANAVMQPLLNHFADVEEIKRKFYDYHLIPTREIERFRNDLSWRYRLEIYWGEPQSIYESQFNLFALASPGIKIIQVYGPRNRELAKLTGIPALVTLLLEFQDAIAPRLRTITAFIGRGIVYLLKNILGRGIGLVGSGILQGIGASFGSDGKLKNRNQRSR